MKRILERILASLEFMRQLHIAELFLSYDANRVAEVTVFTGLIAAQSPDAVIKIAPRHKPPTG
jgi:hypothetical protein